MRTAKGAATAAGKRRQRQIKADAVLACAFARIMAAMRDRADSGSFRHHFALAQAGAKPDLADIFWCPVCRSNRQCAAVSTRSVAIGVPRQTVQTAVPRPRRAGQQCNMDRPRYRIAPQGLTNFAPPDVPDRVRMLDPTCRKAGSD